MPGVPLSQTIICLTPNPLASITSKRLTHMRQSVKTYAPWHKVSPTARLISARYPRVDNRSFAICGLRFLPSASTRSVPMLPLARPASWNPPEEYGGSVNMKSGCSVPNNAPLSSTLVQSPHISRCGPICQICPRSVPHFSRSSSARSICGSGSCNGSCRSGNSWRSSLARASSMALTSASLKRTSSSRLKRFSLSWVAIAANGSMVNSSLSASSAVTSRTSTGTFWSCMTSRRRCPSISCNPSGVSLAITASAMPISSRTPDKAFRWPSGWVRQLRGLGISSDAGTLINFLIRSLTYKLTPKKPAVYIGLA